MTSVKLHIPPLRQLTTAVVAAHVSLEGIIKLLPLLAPIIDEKENRPWIEFGLEYINGALYNVRYYDLDDTYKEIFIIYRKLTPLTNRKGGYYMRSKSQFVPWQNFDRLRTKKWFLPNA